MGILGSAIKLFLNFHSIGTIKRGLACECKTRFQEPKFAQNQSLKHKAPSPEHKILKGKCSFHQTELLARTMMHITVRCIEKKDQFCCCFVTTTEQSISSENKNRQVI